LVVYIGYIYMLTYMYITFTCPHVYFIGKKSEGTVHPNFYF
jgi:hypothetical protein